MDYVTPSEIISKVGQYLQETLTVDNVKELEKLRFELAEKKNEWLQKLHERENQMLHPKDKELTELDRKTMLNASVAVIRRDYEFLKDLDRIVEQRIELFKILTPNK